MERQTLHSLTYYETEKKTNPKYRKAESRWETKSTGGLGRCRIMDHKISFRQENQAVEINGTSW
jgi:hypothetical protein